MATNSNSDNSRKGGFFNNILTFCSFCFLCTASPFLFVNYCVLQYSRKLWLALLSNRFPNLEFVKTHSVRSLVDSWRNPAVINILMEIKGKCDRNAILEAVSEHLLDKRDKRSGQLSYQHLRRQLVSCWGSYAWDVTCTDAFDVNKHVVGGPKNFRGRPITEANIQEYVSAITRKYLPSNQPPWQIVIIPNVVSLEEKYYVLVRLHHLLLSKEYRINVGDFLLLKSRPRTAQSSPESKQPSTERSALGIRELPKRSEMDLQGLQTLPSISRGFVAVPGTSKESDVEQRELDSPESDQTITEFSLESRSTQRIDQSDLQQLQKHKFISQSRSEDVEACSGSRQSVAQSQKTSSKSCLSEESSPLLDVFESPIAIPELRQRLKMTMTNFWNEFISAYDPLEKPNKTPIGIWHLSAVFVIILGSVWKEFNKGLSPKASWSFRMKYLTASIDRELCRRGIDSTSVFNSLLVTINPINFAIFYTKLWLSLMKSFCKLPLRITQEFLASISILQRGYCTYPNTATAFLHDNVPLIYGALKEFWYIFLVIYNAPMRLISDIFSNGEEPLHNLQTVSLCGRKVVAWSNTVQMDVIRSISQEAGVTTSEVVLSAACGALSDYFRENDMPVPSHINATVRHVRQDFLLRPFSPLKTSNRDRIGGVVCISLPLQHADNSEECLKNLELVKDSLSKTRKNQKALYCLSLIQTRHGTVTRALPSVVSKLCAGYLSRKYAVTLTEVASGNGDIGDSGSSGDSRCEEEMVTQWGHEVTSVMYWRPPQANISVSITFQEYGSHMRMGLMADAQLAPNHAELTSSWSARITDMARACGVSCDVILQVPVMPTRTPTATSDLPTSNLETVKNETPSTSAIGKTDFDSSELVQGGSKDEFEQVKSGADVGSDDRGELDESRVDNRSDLISEDNSEATESSQEIEYAMEVTGIDFES